MAYKTSEQAMMRVGGVDLGIAYRKLGIHALLLNKRDHKTLDAAPQFI